MRRQTTTFQLNKALSSGLLTVTKSEVYHKTTRQTDVIDADSFLESFQFVCESGCFADCVGWHFTRDYKTGLYIVECGRTDGDAENIVTAYLRVKDGVSREDVDKALRVIEEE